MEDLLFVETYESPQPKTFPATLRLSMSGFGKRLSARVSTLQPNRKMAVAVGPIVASNIDTPPTSETAIWLWFGWFIWLTHSSGWIAVVWLVTPDSTK